ncbi:hypothetical protein O1L55_37145 [Streptomyces albulus]|nr:hypothetical protein [Streptomyces noursei]
MAGPVRHRPRLELSNYLFTATATGFWAAEQQDLLRPYVARYFTEVPASPSAAGPPSPRPPAGGRSPPSSSRRTLRRGEQCLAEGDPTPALRRTLDDQLADLRRALRVRAAAVR